MAYAAETNPKQIQIRANDSELSFPVTTNYGTTFLYKKPFDYIEITFDEPINGESFTTDDIKFIDPFDNIIPVYDLVYKGNNTWRLHFLSQESNGKYKLTIGPNIEDLEGNKLDLDKDGIFGEPIDDVYEIIFYINLAPEHLVLIIDISSSYTIGGMIEGYLKSINNDKTVFITLDSDTENEVVNLLSDTQFDQVWLIDTSLNNYSDENNCEEDTGSLSKDKYDSAWQAIAGWYKAEKDREIIIDARIISSYNDNQNSRREEGKRLNENYYENLKLKGGGLVLGTDDCRFHKYGINSVNKSIGIHLFFGRFSDNDSIIPVDLENPLMTYPNYFEGGLFDDSTPALAPYGLQPNGMILYSVAWHSGQTNTPGISSTIKGVVGFHAKIELPINESEYYEKEIILFRATCTNATEPVKYTWTSSIDGVIGFGKLLEYSALSIDKHIITLTGEDSSTTSGADSDSVQLTIIERSKLESIEFNDADGNSLLSIGDEYYFHFSTKMKTANIKNNTNDANTHLIPGNELIYGDSNKIKWINDNKTVIVTITQNFTIQGNEVVKPFKLLDFEGNEVGGNESLHLIDTIKPVFTDVRGNYNNTKTVHGVNDYRLTIVFDTSMNINISPKIGMVSSGNIQPGRMYSLGEDNTV